MESSTRGSTGSHALIITITGRQIERAIFLSQIAVLRRSTIAARAGEDADSGMFSEDQRDKHKKLVEKLTELKETHTGRGIDEDVIKGKLLEQLQKRSLLGPSESKPYGGVCGLTRKRLLFILLPCLVAAIALYTNDEGFWEAYMASPCLVEASVLLAEVGRPLVDCNLCDGLKQVEVVHKLSEAEFIKRYAYTGVPVLVKEATANWTAMDTFSFDFFKRIFNFQLFIS